MHPHKVLLHVIRPIELLQAGVTMEWLLLFVNVLVAREQVTPVRGVRTACAGVTLSGGSSDGRRRGAEVAFALVGLRNVESAATAGGRAIQRFYLGLLARFVGVRSGRVFAATRTPRLLAGGLFLLLLPAIVTGHGDKIWN